MRLKRTFKYHFLLGIIIIGMSLFDSYIRMGPEKLYERLFPLGIIYLFTFNIAFFCVYAINYKIICPNTLPKKNVLLFILGQISLFFIFAGVRYFFEEILVYSIGGFHNYSDRTRVFWFYIFDNSYYALKAILFSTFMYFLFMYLKSSSTIHQLQLEQQKAKLDALKTQLEPHFLFNTLNVFYSELADKQPETAKGIHKLSELLRYLTYDAQKDFMPLKKELKFIEDYVYFYKKRFENNLFLNFSINGDIKQQEIPSLILIHFIENIFKHGITNDSSIPAEISIKINDNNLELMTKNKISNVKNYSSTGIGRENLNKRLQLLFNDNYTFNHKESNNTYSTYLKIPLKNN